MGKGWQINGYEQVYRSKRNDKRGCIQDNLRWSCSLFWLIALGFSLSGCAEPPSSGNLASASAQATVNLEQLPEEIPPSPKTIEPTVPETLARAATTSAAETALTAKTGTPGDLPVGDHQGRLRVGNQTEHPLRLAFLQQSLQTGVAGSPESKALAKADLEPIHWDFAPGEGGQSGLIMSVTQGDIELRQGDVLVAFAQDGSRRYWGPYIVGQTQLPYWNAERSEWQLLIQP